MYVHIVKFALFQTEMPCPTPENITDGTVTIGGTLAVSASPVLNDTADHVCNAGYDLLGAPVRTCIALGPGLVGWDPVSPTCNSMYSYNPSISNCTK